MKHYKFRVERNGEREFFYTPIEQTSIVEHKNNIVAIVVNGETICNGDWGKIEIICAVDLLEHLQS